MPSRTIFAGGVKVRLRFRSGRSRGVPALRLAEAIAAAAFGADGLEAVTLERLAIRAATLADRSRGERGGLR